jgi:hypothetical protein
MSIMLGNLSVAEMESRLGVAFPTEARKALEASRQDLASPVAAGKWHCFDMPFMLLCGDMPTADKIHKMLQPLGAQMKCQLQIGVGH